MHRGRFQAKGGCQDCQLLVVDALTFQDNVSQFFTTEVDPKIYAQSFVDCLNMKEDGNLSDFDPKLARVTWSPGAQPDWDPTMSQSISGSCRSSISSCHSGNGHVSPAHSLTRRFSSFSNLFGPLRNQSLATGVFHGGTMSTTSERVFESPRQQRRSPKSLTLERATLSDLSQRSRSNSPDVTLVLPTRPFNTR